MASSTANSHQEQNKISVKQRMVDMLVEYTLSGQMVTESAMESRFTPAELNRHLVSARRAATIELENRGFTPECM